MHVLRFQFQWDAGPCREGYVDAQGVIAHLENVSSLLDQVVKIADIIRLEVHAPSAEIEKLQQPLSALNPEYYTMEIGFRC
jgi:hypothetical protein